MYLQLLYVYCVGVWRMPCRTEDSELTASWCLVTEDSELTASWCLVTNLGGAAAVSRHMSQGVARPRGRWVRLEHAASDLRMETTKYNFSGELCQLAGVGVQVGAQVQDISTDFTLSDVMWTLESLKREETKQPYWRLPFIVRKLSAIFSSLASVTKKYFSM